MTDKTERAFELNGLKALNKHLETENQELRQRIQQAEDRIKQQEDRIRQLVEERDTLEHDLEYWKEG